MESIDTIYEFAGYEAALALWGALSGLGIPLLVAFGGVAWRFMRVAEDGLARPLLLHFFGLVLLWWLISPVAVADARIDARAPRFAAWLTAGTDTFTRGAIRKIDADFLDKPYEWERIAAMCGRADVFDARLKDDLHSFFASCTSQALGAPDARPAPAAERNPLRHDTGLPYGRFTMMLQDRLLTCERARTELEARVLEHVRTSHAHRRVLDAARAYDGRLTEEMYLDQVVFNVWRGPADFTDAHFARTAVGTIDPLADQQNAMPLGEGRDPHPVRQLVSRVGNFITGLYAIVKQTVGTTVEAKQQHYTVATLGPELYGVSIMLLLALFPLAALWALVPGRWTALFSFAKVYVAVKLWPVGWALLTYFTQRRPSTEALSFVGVGDGGTRGVYTAAAMMYMVVPALCFIVVHIGASAAALPFREAAPSPAGGNPAAAALAVVRAAR